MGMRSQLSVTGVRGRGTDRTLSGGLRAQPHLRFPTPSRYQWHQWLESGGSVIPLRVSSGLSPDSCAGESPATWLPHT